MPEKLLVSPCPFLLRGYSVKIEFILLALLLPSCAWGLEIKSNSFTQGSKIPSEYACDSSDISPSLEWGGSPAGTKSFVLICDDPDAPAGIWSHWVIFNIPKEKTGLPENVAKTGRLGDGTIQGTNDFGKPGYGGPCPPPGRPHRYFFRLYAIDTVLSLKNDSIRGDVLKAIKGHILAEAELFGIYER